MAKINRFLLLILSLAVFSFPVQANKIVVGAENVDAYVPFLKGKRVGLVVNQTSRVFDQHLVDYLITKGVNINAIFAPEHGFRGDHDAGQHVKSNTDAKTGIKIHSIYGKHKIPSDDIMSSVDVIIFDIQDVGARFYTYISSMHYMMLASANNDKQFIVLDRPNPNGAYVDGPLREDEFSSFVGKHPIPLLHGMTVGELAMMIVGESWLETDANLNLTVIPVGNYQRGFDYSLPVKPSPNLPNDQAIKLYPSLCLFEPTVVSIGRGTDWPFQIIGFNSAPSANFSFTPESRPGASSNPKLKGIKLEGWDMRNKSLVGLDLKPLITWYQFIAKNHGKFFTSPSFFDKLAGTDKLRMAIIAGKSASEIKQSWQADLTKFRKQRKPYLLYPDI